MAILYIDNFSGISGDMFLAAMLDAGLPKSYLEEQIQLLQLSAYKGLEIKEVQKNNFHACSLTWQIEEETQHRYLKDIEILLHQSRLKQSIIEKSIHIFKNLATAEAKVHGTTIEQVHFHEVGAADSILDIVGAVIALDYFSIEQVFSSPLPYSSGRIENQHGVIPLPAPAVVELCKSANVPLVPIHSTCELVTPTGAALVSTLAKFEQPEMIITQSGVGAGKKELPWANIIRVFIGTSNKMMETHVELCTNIDDMNPQFYQYIMHKCFENGALDVYLTNIIMKKNRPAVQLSIIAKKEDEEKLANLLINETTTYGVRVFPMHRYEAERYTKIFHTPLGDISVKVKRHHQQVQISPEYDSIEKIAQQTSQPIDEVYLLAKETAKKELGLSQK